MNDWHFMSRINRSSKMLRRTAEIAVMVLLKTVVIQAAAGLLLLYTKCNRRYYSNRNYLLMLRIFLNQSIKKLYFKTKSLFVLPLLHMYLNVRYVLQDYFSLIGVIYYLKREYINDAQYQWGFKLLKYYGYCNFCSILFLWKNSTVSCLCRQLYSD